MPALATPSPQSGSNMYTFTRTLPGMETLQYPRSVLLHLPPGLQCVRPLVNDALPPARRLLVNPHIGILGTTLYPLQDSGEGDFGDCRSRDHIEATRRAEK